MNKYNVVIEETVVGEFEVIAKNVQEAYEIARKKYKEEEFVLCPGELQFKQMAVHKPCEEIKEWIEF